MNRKQALKKLENMFKVGFSYLNVRALLNEIYDSLEQDNPPTLLNKIGITNKALEGGRQSIKSPIVNNNKEVPIPSSKAQSLTQSHNKSSKEYYCLKIDELIKSGYNIESSANKTVYILNSKKYGIVKYYPKANKLHICKHNKWLEKGFNIIIKNLEQFK